MDEKEKCPHCEGEMRSGLVMSRRSIFWLENMPSNVLNVENGEKISTFKRFKGMYVRAHRCNSCGLILIIKSP
ncbi:MAG: PF20097 family protein [Candidatus Hermodarchaeota archaeon]